jgi:branched-chain amino acid transport system substrate-binding protein
VKLIDADTGCSPPLGATEATKLTVRDKVHFIFGDYCSSSTLAAMLIVAKTNTPMFVIRLAEAITGISHTPNVFRISCGAHLDMPPVAKFAAKEKGHRMFAAVAVNNDWGRSLIEWFGYGLKKYGGEISDHQQSWEYEDGPWNGPGPPLLVAADLSQFINRRHRSDLHPSSMPSR